jgi:hypothetical protein
MRENFINNFLPSALTADQVIEKLTSEIVLLHSWLINCGEDYTSKVFNEKLRLLKDKIEEREKFERISQEESESIN